MIDCWSNFCGKSNPFGACVPPPSRDLLDRLSFCRRPKVQLSAAGGWEKLAPLDFDNIKSLANVIAGDRIGVISGSTQWGGGCCLCVSLSNSHNIEHRQLCVVVVLILPFSIGSIRFVLYSNKCSPMHSSNACAVAGDVMHVA